MHETLHALRSRGWNVALDTPRELFTSAQRRRYPSAPPLFRAFLGSILDCSSPRKQCWLYGPRQFARSGARGFRWNECERMSLDGFAGDEAGAAEVRAFWDHHIPFMMAVHSDYDYLALRLDSTPVVVHGCAPEFEEASVLSTTFEGFLTDLRDAARSSDPPWPLRVFLADDPGSATSG